MAVVFYEKENFGKFPKSYFLIVLIVLGGSLLRASFVHSANILPGEYEVMVVSDTIVSNYGSVTEVKIQGESVKIGAPRYPEFTAGDKVLVTIKKVYPSGHFAAGSLELLEKAQGVSLPAALVAVRRNFMKSLSSVLPEPHATFVGGTVVGGSAGLPKNLQDSFRATGISHILAASGYNFSLLLIFLGALLRWLPLRFRNLLFLAVIPCFAVVAGAHAAVIRAGIMAGLASFALLSGRISAARSTVLWAAFIILFFNPKLLIFDLGFQLSFLATLGMAYVVPLFEKFFQADYKKPYLSALYGIFFATVSAQLATAPLIAYTFGTVSVVSLFVNILVVGFIPAIMVIGIVSAALSVVSLTLAKILAWPSYLLSSYVFKVSEIFSGFSWSQMHASVSLWGTVLSYLGIFAVILYLRHRFLIHNHEKSA